MLLISIATLLYIIISISVDRCTIDTIRSGRDTISRHARSRRARSELRGLAAVVVSYVRSIASMHVFVVSCVVDRSRSSIAVPHRDIIMLYMRQLIILITLRIVRCTQYDTLHTYDIRVHMCMSHASICYDTTYYI